MDVLEYIYLGFFILVMAISFLTMIGFCIWSLSILWCAMNSDLVERNRRIREFHRRLKD